MHEERRKVSSVEETWSAAREFASHLVAGDIIRLEGDLGAGKTTFVQGLAAALGAKGRVASPTFCIVREHDASPNKLVHMDLYRLRSGDDLEAIGWDEYLAQGAIIAVEWPERAGQLIPPDAKRVVLEHTAESDGRFITMRW